jgi:hypothetical protein
MPGKPRTTIDDALVQGRSCSICGEASLSVVRHAGLPDHVLCGRCGSAFVMEDSGDRVMYGRIAADFARARRFALRQWAFTEAVERWAASEREGTRPTGASHAQPASAAGRAVPAAPLPEASLAGTVPLPRDLEPARTPEPEPSYPPAPVPESSPVEPVSGSEILIAQPPGSGAVRISGEGEAFPPPSRPVPLSADEAEVPSWIPTAPQQEPEPPYPLEVEPRTPRPSQPVPQVTPMTATEGEEALLPPALPLSAPEVTAPAGPLPTREQPAGETGVPAAPPRPPGEPPPGMRYRVVTSGEKVAFPWAVCAHCLRTPAPKRMPVVASLPKKQAMTQRRAVTFTVPLCADCAKRAHSRSEGEKSERLQAQLMSILSALILLLITLLTGLADFRARPLPSLFVAITALALGYAVPATLLLKRARRFPAPPETTYVRTTLLIPSETQGLEVAFEWRNQGYAELFHHANRRRALGAVIAVKDRTQSDSAT